MADENNNEEEKQKPAGFVGKVFNFDAFVKKTVIIHGNKYDYSLVNYVGCKVKIKIKCKKHNHVFEQTPDCHLKGNGCYLCTKEKQRNCKLLDKETFTLKANKIHKNIYDYSKFIYINSKIKNIITCKTHGDYLQSANKHLIGRGCPKCSKKYKPTTKEFIKKAEKIHKKKYCYSLIEYKNAFTKIQIKCNKCLITFSQTPDNHLKGKGCPKCKSSTGERTIREFLQQNNIIFEEQKRFSECKNKFPLRFDFYLPNQNILIEYDGEQHFKPIKFWRGDDGLKTVKQNDKIKNQFAEQNNIKLIRIPYTSFDEMEGILLKGIR